MKILLDFFPWLFFVAGFVYKDIYWGTAALMVATVVQMIIVYWIDKKLTILHKVTLVLVLVFGALTLALHNPMFIQWKPTVFYIGLALVIGVAQWGWRKNLLKIILGHQIDLPQAMWQNLIVAWVIFCLFMGTLNAIVAMFFSTKAYVYFKLWGFIFPILFFLALGLYIARYYKSLPEHSDW